MYARLWLLKILKRGCPYNILPLWEFFPPAFVISPFFDLQNTC